MDGAQVRRRGMRMWFSGALARIFKPRSEKPASRRRVLLGLSATIVLASVALWWVVDVPCLNNTGAVDRSWAERLLQHGVARLTFAGTPEAAQAVLQDWERSCAAPASEAGTTWQSLARARLWWVFAFIGAYWMLTCCVVGLMLMQKRASLMRMFSLLIAFFIMMAGVLGAVANSVTLSALANGGTGSAPAIARFLAILQVSLLLCTVLYLAIGLPLEHFKKSLRRINNLYRKPTLSSSEQARERIIESVPKPSHTLAGAEGRAAQLSDVREEELAYITHHRHPNREPEENGELLVGLALSGGGIRAATTGLGALQALAHLDVLPLVDYVSSVSGGGYIASALSSLGSLNNQRLPASPAYGRASPDDVQDEPEPDADAVIEEQKTDPHVFEEEDAPAFGPRWFDFPFRSDSNGSPKSMRAAALIAHLRTHGNFLIARRGILTRDTLRAIGNVLNGIVFSVGGFLLTMFGVAALYLLAVFALSPDIDSALMYKLPASSLATVLPPKFGVLDSTQVREYVATCDSTAPAGCVTKNQSSLRAPTLREWMNFQIAALTLVPRRAFLGGSSLSGAAADDAVTMRRALIAAALTGAFATALALLALLLVLMVFRDGGYLAQPLPGEAEEDVFDKAFLWFQGLITLAFVVVATIAWRQTGVAPENRLVGLWLPLATLLGARIVGFSASIFMPQLLGHKHWSRRFRTLWGGFQASIVYGLWMAIVFAILAPMMFAVAGHGVTLATGSVISLIAARLLTRTNGWDPLESTCRHASLSIL